MEPMHGFIYLRLGTNGLLGLYFLCTGLYGLAVRRPTLISMKWLLALVLVIVFSTLGTPFLLPGHMPKVAALFAVLVPVLVLLVVYMGKAAQGYTLTGTDDVSFRKALLAATAQLGLKTTEDMTGIHLGEGLTLKGPVMMGMGQLRIRGKDSQGVVARLVPVLKEELSKPGVAYNPFPFVFYLVVGLTLIAVSGILMNLF